MEKERLVSLVTAAQRGNARAMNELFNAFYPHVFYFVLKTVRNRELAADITQETFIEVIDTLHKLEHPEAFVTWAKRIAYHQCTKYFRKERDLLADKDGDGFSVLEATRGEREEFIPDEVVDKDELRRTVMAMIDGLPEEQRTTILLFYFEELSIRQIADIQGINENTVKSRLNYGRNRIRQAVADYEERTGTKLHAVPIFPLLGWAFEDAFTEGMSLPVATAMAEKVSAATGIPLSVNGAPVQAAPAPVSMAPAVGLGAKFAALPMVTKILAGVAALAVAVATPTVGVMLANGTLRIGTPEDSSLVEHEDSLPRPVTTTTDAVTPGNTTIGNAAPDTTAAVNPETTSRGNTVPDTTTAAPHSTVTQNTSAPVLEYFNDGNNAIEPNAVAVKPRHVYWQDGKLVAQCFVINGYNTAVRNITVDSLSFENEEVAIAAGSFGLLDRPDVPSNSIILWNFVFEPSAVITPNADLSLLICRYRTSFENV